jgi:hypothetical protein
MRLVVPLIQQTGNMTCWHAAARMLWAYKYQQSINPLPERFAMNRGITAAEFINLASEVGLFTLSMVTQTYAPSYIEMLLNIWGPIWAAGQWYGPNHIIVLTGVDTDGTLYVNDPGRHLPRVHDMGWFNEKIDKTVAIPMMFLP